MNTDSSALRYSPLHENSLGDRYGRNNVLVALAGEGRRILELGCNTGFISRHLAEKGCRITGVEIDPQAAELARPWCERVLTLDLNKTDWTNQLEGTYDTVLCGDVLEHLLDPASVLRSAMRLLESQGTLVLSLPNIAHWSVRIQLLFGRFDYQSTGILDSTHLRFFTLKTARQLIEEAGYTITQFCPVIGGRLSGHFRAGWQLAANCFPGLFAYQMLFTAMSFPATRNNLGRANDI